MRTIQITLMVSLILLVLYQFKLPNDLPKGWFKVDKTDSYKLGLDQVIFKNGHQSVFIESKYKEIDGFGALMQPCLSNDYIGKRIKLTGYIKSENVTGWSGMWMGVSSQITELSFENMEKRPIKGSTDWTKCEIVMDVPSESVGLSYGVLLHGTGKIWFDNLSFEVVGELPSKSSKDINKNPLILPNVAEKPFNLNFEE